MAATHRFVNTFLYGFFTHDNSTFMRAYIHTFLRLLTFHDAKLSMYLQDLGLGAELYAIPWFMTAFSHIFSIGDIVGGASGSRNDCGASCKLGVWDGIIGACCNWKRPRFEDEYDSSQEEETQGSLNILVEGNETLFEQCLDNNRHFPHVR